MEKRTHRRKVVPILLAVALLLGGIYFATKSGTDPEVYSNDFNVYYYAAREVAAGRDPYQNSLGSWTTYLYPPLLAETLVPLALLPLPVAAYIWFLISAASVAAAARMSARLAITGEQSSHDKLLLVAVAAVALTARFILDNLNLGQVNNIVAALAVAHVYLYSKQKRLASAAALALAVSIKLTPGVLILYQIARLRLKFALLCVSLIAVVTFASMLPFGQRAPGVIEAFIDRTIMNEQGFDLAYSGNQSLRGALLRLGTDSDNNPVGAISMVLALLILAISVMTARRARTEIAAAAPFFCCMVLLSPLSWKAHFVVLILPLAYLAAQAINRNVAQNRLILASLIVVFLLFNLTSRLIIGDPASERADSLSLVFAAAALIYVVTVWSSVFGKRGDVLLISNRRASGEEQL
jgi:alpha-1,2-mannosyltransferase